MKKTLFTSFTLIGLVAFAQQEAPPQGINYQAVVYSDNGNNQPGLNSPGQVLWNEDIGVQFSILSGSATGTVIYKETHATSTDEFGMFNLVIGQGLVQGTQSFNMIDWGSGYHFLKVEVDKTGGTDYVEMSIQQLWSVPYALYSGYSSSSGYADSAAYADIAGNGLTGVTDNGDGTLTFTYYDGSTYTTAVLSGLGSVGPQGPAGADGQDGQDGLSAYEIWLSQGNTGSEQDFLNSLEGPQGPAGTNGVDGINGIDGTNGIDGQDGQSAYEIWLSQGNTGTEQDFLNSLEGPQGPEGNGISNTTDNGDGTFTITFDDSSSVLVDLQDADSDPTNELQALSLSNDTLILTNGGQIYLGELLNGSVGGGGSTGCASCITEISSVSPTPLTFAGAVDYCINLVENGHTDWRLPSWAEVYYYRIDMDLTGPWSTQYLWAGYWGGSENSITTHMVYVESTMEGSAFTSYSTDTNKCRCVR